MAQFAELPVIDFEVLCARNENGQRTSEALAMRHNLFLALRDTGFTYLRRPKTNQAEMNQLFNHSKRFFAKPLEVKTQILGQMEKGRGPSQGYSCPVKLAKNPETSDIKEFFGMYRDDDNEKPNQWLSDSESQAMRRDLVAFFERSHNVILELLSCLAEEIGLESNALHSAISDRNHFIACLFYPSTPAESFKTRIRAAAHTDYGCLTLLFNDDGEGLQVLRRDGQYQYVPRKSDCAVLNVGDLLSRFFNGTLPSTMHRVVEPPQTTHESETVVADRYSIAFFGHFNLEELVKPLAALCTEADPPKYAPVLAGEHVKARVRQLHLAGHSIKDEAKLTAIIT